MRSIRFAVCLLGTTLLALLLVDTCFAAQKTNGPKYDPKSEITLKGIVEDVKNVTTNGENAIHLMVKSGETVQEVCLCPKAFLDEVAVEFAKGDEIEVTGSKQKTDGGDVVLAREIVKGNNTLVLRDKQGNPVWTWLKKS